MKLKTLRSCLRLSRGFSVVFLYCFTWTDKTVCGLIWDEIKRLRKLVGMDPNNTGDEGWESCSTAVQTGKQ